MGIVLFIRLLFIYYDVSSVSESPKECFVSSELLCKPFLLDSFTTVLALWISLHFVWVMLLLVVQVFQISLSITTNDARNFYKYGFIDGIEHKFYNESLASRLRVTLLNNQSLNYHYSPRKKQIFWKLLRFLGVYHFLKIVNIFIMRFTLGSNRIKNPFNNGVLSNCRDFWSIGIGKKNGLGIINTKQSYNEGFGYIKGHLVNYYYLYDFSLFHEDLNKDYQDVLLDEI
ncbi:hypothetical protein PMAC_002209 [Pneumocystis sp. 'macacae']|nr:hypothetical protein PMAC_002209 [Pneumocystis sp. 'macacae']